MLDRYFTDESMQILAKALVSEMQGLSMVLDQAPPVEVGLDDGFLVLAAFDMCSATALRNLGRDDHADPMIVLRDAADSTVHVTVTMALTETDFVKVGGLELAIGRKVITAVLEQLRSGRRECTCGSAHRADSGCDVQDRLAADLPALGGWGTHGDD